MPKWAVYLIFAAVIIGLYSRAPAATQQFVGHEISGVSTWVQAEFKGQ